MSSTRPGVIDNSTIAEAEEYRQRHATSLLSIVFTDIARSTELREQLGEVAYEQEREAHDQLVRSIIEAQGAGAVVKSTGDGALAVFAEPSTAVTRALELQKSMAPHPYFKLRIGIDMGQVSVSLSGGIVADVFGRQVNRAARLQAIAQPGHVLTSFQVYDCADGWLTGSRVRWHNHGRLLLKGFAESASIHEPYDSERSSPQELHAPERGEANEARTPIGSGVGRRLIRIHPVGSVPTEDPFRFYGEAIALAVARFTTLSTRSVTVLWVDDYPDNNLLGRRILEAAGCRIDLALSTSEATCRLIEKVYSLVLSDMGRANNPVAGLELLDWLRTQEKHVPAIIVCSSRAVSLYEQEAIARGALLCTAGFVSLLDGLLQVLEQLWYFGSVGEPREGASGSWADG